MDVFFINGVKIKRQQCLIKFQLAYFETMKNKPLYYGENAQCYL